MDRRGVFFASIVCSLISLAVASEPGPGQSRVTGSHELEPSLLAAPASSGWVTNITGSSGVVGQDEVVPEHVPGSRVERTDNEPQVEQEQEAEEQEDYEGEDEYEDELKAVVESHEAMSRDDTRNSNAFTATSSKLVDETSTTGPANNFDSREVITADNSDEDVASNEAITDEFLDKYDQEVAELLKYKKARNSNQNEGSRTKTKRVPTVKKELSTQKEILIGSNETQVPKSLLPPEDTVNRLNEETEAIRRRNVDSDKQIKLGDSGYSEKSAGEVEVATDNRYSESEAESPKKLDKRQETVLKDLKSYLLTEYATEEEQRQKLLQLGAQKDALAENVLKLLAKLAENPNRWERVQQLLLNTENDLNLSKNAVEPSKRGYESSSTLFPDTPRPREDSRKSRKKSKKKKKNPKHRFSTTTLTPVPATPPLLTTTETPWQTTPVQWRLVAERLFAPPWQEQTEKTTNTRYSVPQSPRTLSSIRDLIERSKPKSNLKSFPSDRKATITEDVAELADQRLMRFGNVGSRQAGRIEPHGEFVNVYDRSTDPERVPDFDVPYHRPRYDQFPPDSHEFLHRHEEDYQSDSSMPVDAFGRGQDYEGHARDFSLSKSWPDILRYNAPWKGMEGPMIPIAYDKWPWRQPQSDPKYWPQRAGYLPVEKSYWSAFGNEYEPDEEAEAAKIWEEQRARHSWDRERAWPQEKPLKMPPSWQQVERPAKVYVDRDQPNGAWEKSKNRSELTRSKESKEKVVLPQITMKTWNSLTSDPATWPHKLPGAKPWPKDENGKSYNPNADLVKKLGLDKQNGAVWPKDENEKSSAERKMKEDKQNRLFAKDSVKSEEMLRTEVSKYKSNDERSNFSDNKAIKPWTMLTDKNSKDWIKSEDAQADDSGAWRRKYESKSSWSDDATLPKIQSVGAWVMAADQSTWKPYQIKPLESSNDVGSRRWPKARSNKGSWEKTNDSWMDHANAPLDIWPGKSNKPGSWFAKAKDTDGWTSKSNSPDTWKAKGDWLSKPESSSWISKTGDNDSWPSRGYNGGSWSTKGNESWTSKINDDGSKFNGDSWTSKTKEEDSGDAWSRKSNEQNGWGTKNNELTPWQQKMNDEWNYGKSSSTGTWPAKWKQFAYHRVTAIPISKPGTTSDANSSKSKNAFVAVSAVSSPKYTGNEWRKNEEERNEKEEQERSSNQVQVGLERPIYAWKKDSGPRTASTKSNATDPLENQLEALRQIDFWAYKENEAEKRLTSTNASTETTSTIPRNSTSTAMATQRRSGTGTGNSNGLSETNRRAISMK